MQRRRQKETEQQQVATHAAKEATAKATAKATATATVSKKAKKDDDGCGNASKDEDVQTMFVRLPHISKRASPRPDCQKQAKAI